MIDRVGEPFHRRVALESFPEVVRHRERSPATDVGVEVRGVGREHGVAAARFYPHALQSLGMSADLVHRKASNLLSAVVKHDAAFEHLSHHLRRFSILQMVTSVRKRVVIAAVVVMEVRHDHVFYDIWANANRNQSFLDRLDNRPAALASHRSVEAGIHNECPAGTDNRPKEKASRGSKRREPGAVGRVLYSLLAWLTDGVIDRRASHAARLSGGGNGRRRANASPSWIGRTGKFDAGFSTTSTRRPIRCLNTN